MENTLYVISNINMRTVELVASCLSRRYKEGFKQIVIFESREAEKFEQEQTEIYRKYFCDFEKRTVLLNEDGSIPPDHLYSVFNISGNRVVDLSNGPKVTTSSLFLASSLCRVDDIYCLIFHTQPTQNMMEGTDFEYIKLRNMEGIERLAKISYFDLIYYTEDINSLITDEDKMNSSSLTAIYQGMIGGISGFFTGTADANAVIYNLTIGTDTIVDAFLNYLQNNSKARSFAASNNINLSYNGDPIGILSRFYKIYTRNFGSDPELICLCTVPGLLSGLRDYRNISAHYANNSATLTDDNARTVINMQIEVMKCLHDNNDLWRSL